MEKVMFFAFQGEPVCFAHAMMNVLEMKSRGFECGLIIEGKAAALIEELAKESHPQHGLYQKILDGGLLEGVCQACCHQMGTLEYAKKANLPLLSDMNGHPAMGPYIEDGYRIITL